MDDSTPFNSLPLSSICLIASLCIALGGVSLVGQSGKNHGSWKIINTECEEIYIVGRLIKKAVIFVVHKFLYPITRERRVPLSKVQLEKGGMMKQTGDQDSSAQAENMRKS